MITYLSEWLKSKSTDNIKCWEECGAIRRLIHWCWLWLQNGTVTLEDSLVISYKLDIVFLSIYPNELKLMSTQTPLHNVHRIFVHNFQNLELNKIPLNRWMDLWWYIHLIDYYLVIERNELSRHEKAWRKLQYILISERSQYEKLHTTNYMTFWKQNKTKQL